MFYKKYFKAALLGCLFSFSPLAAQEWQTNFETAQKLAEKSNNKIVLVFQGSDWCAPCIKLEREIWSTNEFQNLAKDRLIMLKADFPRKQKNKLPAEQEEHNKTLAIKYNQNGYFPYVIVLDPSGIVLGDAGYEKTTPTAYFNKLNSF